ncbi:uncharacterized protein LOC120440835 [Oreochromis aureus]|uniref:uncharacterized protein LOC120440835 n=1 Tax=Oreochromis aureus TaxID=47969 RepID=UPI0019549DB9|nr:uncharacterized protein LOC120440835 [Oreochromis aureus]
MPRTCCIINCTSRENDSRVKSTGNAFGFYRIPAWKRNSPSHVSEVTKRRRMAWIAAIRRPNITFENTPPHMLVCSKHFHNGKPAYEMLECDPDWAPSLKLGHTEVKASTTARFDRLKQRSKSKQPRKGPRSSGAETAHAGEIHPAPVTTETIAESQPQQINPKHEDEDLQECKMCSQRLQEIAHLQEENLVLKKELSKKKLDMEFLKDENSKVKFYTGLPSFALLMGCYNKSARACQTLTGKFPSFRCSC